MWKLYDMLGILEDTVGYIGSMEYSSEWMHFCYHLYSFKDGFCDEPHNYYALSIYFMIVLNGLGVMDIIKHRKGNNKLLLAFYAFFMGGINRLCIYGFLVYAPTYYNTILDIIESV